ncbi:MAG TPA: hypothetical protein VE961_19190 [Pyrinomonadaceae bacterium]|nr:hypothetical protein [Pyrinomonadaceae bacterium]
MKIVRKSPVRLIFIFVLCFAVYGQEKRNDRPQTQPTPAPRVSPDTQPAASDVVHYTFEFNQPNFVVSHIVLQHDSSGRGTVTFIQRTETPIEEPIQLSPAAMGRIVGLWRDLHFLDSDENYQSAKNFAHLGVYKVGMDDGKRKRTAEYNWSDNKTAWALVNEYRRAADQTIWVFDMKLARDMQPLNAPSLLNELESRLTRNDLSDPQQLVPFLTELKTDEHIPLIARNQADRILKKIGK